jgi:cell surface protein SprA
LSSLKIKNISAFSVTTILISLVWIAANASVPIKSKHSRSNLHWFLLPPDSTGQDTSTKLPFPLRDKKPWERGASKNPFDLADPPVIKETYELDDETNQFNYRSSVGSQPYKLPATMTVKEQLEEENRRQNQQYFKQRAQANNYTSGTGIIPPLKIGPKVFERIFGSGVIDIRPRGTAELTFQGLFNTVRNPQLPPQLQTTGQFDFRQKIQLNVQGNIGDRMKVNINYDTEATFDFENQIKLDYGGREDDIIKKIELGNVSLPLNSQLIQGSQSLFGIKTEMQFGKLRMTTIITQQRGQTNETELIGGAQTTRFNIQADNYDANRHFFLAHYFRDNYDRWLSNLPIVGSPVVIGRVEVWITNRTGMFEGSRDIAGFTDLGEAHRRDNRTLQVNPNPIDTFPSNLTNDLYLYLTGRTGINIDTARLRSSLELRNQLVKDFQQTRVEPLSQYQIQSFARLLNPSEYSIHPQLGYISINQTLQNDDVLMVAFEYTVNGRNYKVGEFTTDIPQNPDNPNVIFAKMLKGPTIRPDLPVWDLMMKNVYALGTFGIQQNEFRFNILYADDPSGADLSFLPIPNEPFLSNKPLIQVFNLDNLNTQQERAPDGLFDFIEGVTVNSQTGRIFIPMAEPFGSFLASRFQNSSPQTVRYYVFPELYDSTRFAAIQLPQYNKFFLRGSYQGQSSNEVSLNATNIPRGSVRVTANGAPLTENVDYTVDYNLGRVKILNSGLLNSGAVIKVTSESNSLFSVQQKSLVGTRLDYTFNKDFMMGATVLWLNERPLTPKVNMGEEPISNVMVGVDGSYKTNSRVLTKLLDKLPFYSTKEISTITLSGEFAKLFPGVQSSLAQGGTAYLDDFEGAEARIDIKQQAGWVLASTPQGMPDLFPEGNLVNDLAYGYRRGKLAWYNIANTFHLPNTLTPNHIRNDPDMLSDDRMRLVSIGEIYPSRQIQRGMPDNLVTLDLAYYPRERGPYNYRFQGVNADGTLTNSRNNWAGIMRKIENPDFETANIEYIEFWMMDPYASNPNPNNTGQMYLHLGNISEDVLRDNLRSAENGLPREPDQTRGMAFSKWGRASINPVINFAFDADPAVRNLQDVGLDGFDDAGERAWFDTTYLQQLAIVHPPGTPAYDRAFSDPSNDNYQYYLGTELDNQRLNILQRYKNFNNHQGNSPTLGQSNESFPTTATNVPDMEDINRDYTLNEFEEYYQYRINIDPSQMLVGQNYITDSLETPIRLANGTNKTIVWYQFKVPVREYERRVGQVLDFRNMRFIRILLTGFEEEQVLRIGELQMVRADWRKWLNSLEEGKESKPTDDADQTQFVVSTVNIEKNSNRVPIPYKVPPGILRELDFSAPQAIQQNEQSISLLVCNLVDGDARAVFKPTRFDLRQYGRLRMFLHAEGPTLQDDEVTAFIRIGTDLTNNYYEYEMPLKVSRSGLTDRDVWPDENEINLLLEDFIDTKIMRSNANHPFTVRYTRQVARGKMTVIGLPDLSNASVMMIGVRNPKALPGSNDDGAPKCAEVWFNELRATDFNNRGGWAAIGTMQAKLADLGQLQVAGRISTIGFGGIDKKIQQRQLDDQYQYDVSTSLELGKFLPAKSGISIPLFLSYGNTLIRPLYNPLNPDTRLQKEISETTDPDRQERIALAADDFTMRRSMNFTNVRKNRLGAGKANLYDIENFSFTYNFNELYRRNQELQFYQIQNYQTMVNYNHSFQNKPFEPFKKIKNKNLTLIKDFNLNYKPQSWGARVQTDRRYGVTVFRPNDLGFSEVPALFDKLYTMTRYYEFAYNLSKGLTTNYNATVLSRIDEPLGQIDRTTPEKRDSIRQNLLSGGRTVQFDQSMRLNYNIPINKIRQLNWVSQSSYTYQATYQWQQAPPAADSLGNTVSNARTQAWNFNANMMMLYNKFPILRSLNNPVQPQKKAKDEDQKDKKDDTKKEGKKEDKKKDQNRSISNPYLAASLRLITSLKNVNVSYTVNEGTTLPGFRPSPQYFGQNFVDEAPGIDFIMGRQDPDFRFKAARNGWLSNDSRITSMAMTDYREQINARATFEPLRDFRIDLNASKQYSIQQQVIFRFDESINDFADLSEPLVNGTYTITYNTYRTSFNPDRAFEIFQQNRLAIAERLAQDVQRPGGERDSLGFPRGYSGISQDVLIPAFLSAYSGRDANEISLTAFPALPDLNWRISYNGLSKLEWVKQFASNIAINNAYTSNYTVAGFQNILQDTAPTNGFTGDYIPDIQIRQIGIVERWGPFLGLDITFINSLTTRIEYKRDRTLNLGLTNSQITEQRGSEFVIGAGYRPTKLAIPILGGGGRSIVLEGDINIRLDFSIQDRVTSIRYLDREDVDPVQGQRIYQLRPTIDYMITEQLMLRLFYDYRRTLPATSNTFETVIQSGGISIRYTIQ